ncbi:ricin B lectin domain-containing protein [Auriculariales sp. MPI-PUGE-AT-0066]|nr:ricin B lectin domain-containing protein [Auriculariales sp. MPI-PUGE-AT-0066]
MSPPVPIGFYRVVNWASKTCLDVENDKPAKGTPLVGWKVDESRTSQVWRLTSDSVLTHVNTGLKLAEDPAAAQPENDVAIVLNDAPGMWVYNPGTEAGTWVFKVYNVNYFMDLESGSDENGTSVRIWKRPDNNPQPQNLWTFQPAKDPKGGDKPDDNGGSTGGALPPTQTP